MAIETLRDLVIIIAGLVVTAATVLVAVIIYLVYYRTSKILTSATNAAVKFEALATLATEEIGKPLIKIAGIIQGITCGIRGLNNMFKRGD